MKKERKNNILFEILAKHYQKQADIYSGMAENGPRKNIGIVLLAFFLVIVFGCVVTIISGVGKQADKTIESIKIPDFVAFSNGYAKVKKSEKKYADYVESLYQVEQGIGEIVEEYHNLLTTKYAYRLILNTAMRDEKNQIVSEYYYVYMGEEIVSKFAVESGDESLAIQLMLVTTTAEDNSGLVELKAVREIQKQDSQEKTSFVPDVLLTPEFLSFSNGYGTSLGTVTQEDYLMTTYEFDADAVEFIVGEYRKVLEERYPYQFVGENEQKSKDGWITKEYYYCYTGEEAVPAFYVNAQDGSIGVQLRIAILTNEDKEDGLVHFSSIEKTIWQEHEEKTTYVPLKITGVTLNCLDLLYKNGSNEPLGGVPEGYAIKYSVTATSTGTKTKKLTHMLVSSNEKVVDKNYKNLTIEALSPGTATITASVFECSTEKEFKVYPVARKENTTLSLSTNAIEINSMEPFSTTITVTMVQKDGPSSIIPLSCGADTKCTWGDWEKIEDKTYNLDVTYEIDPAKFHRESKNGLVIFQMRTDGEGKSKISEDILEYQVVEFIWNIKE